MTSEDQWQEAKRLHAVGSEVRGTVNAKFPFGVFLDLPETPEITGFLDIASYNPTSTDSSPVPLPDVGVSVAGVVSYHDEQSKQIRIRVGPPVHHIIYNGLEN
ncbi:hypothetical protein [Streptomyces cellostaticus]|uniref:hypothetical protein n=1 Tax=Streptomyces cellostaticus TaxID=67285 RepID=UPI00131AD78E|nr:hypothetical protein [Streptomyces cellostaticus]GHI07989.1 hypothetical protein Scel_63100 [Streptomyces cellostaticus]